MDVSIKYGKDRIRFNLYEELMVNENRINEEIANQPTHYAFLSMLLVKLKRSMLDKKAQLDKIEKKLFLEFKQEIDRSTGRPFSNDMAESSVVQTSSYKEALDSYLKAEEDHDTIKVAVESFSQRTSLIQTLSANIRKTN